MGLGDLAQRRSAVLVHVRATEKEKLYSSSQQTWRSYLWVLNCSTAPSACTTLSVQRVQKHFYFEHENTFFLVSFALECEYWGWCAQFSLVISLRFHYIWLNISLEKNTFEILKVFLLFILSITSDYNCPCWRYSEIPLVQSVVKRWIMATATATGTAFLFI